MKKDILFTAEYDKEKNTMTFEDKWLGARTMPNTSRACVEDQLKLLMKMRRDGRKPTRELLNDIKVYKFILKQSDPETAAHAYLEMADAMRDQYKVISVSKMEVARRLGWRIR